MNPLDKLLTHLETLEQRATPGKWYREEGTLLLWSDGHPSKPIAKGESNACGGFQRGLYAEWEPRNNCEFIAASRNAMPKLLEILKSQELTIELCETVLSRLVKGFDNDVATTPNSYAASDCRGALNSTTRHQARIQELAKEIEGGMG